MSVDRFLRNTHRFIAILFLLAMVPAGIVSAQGAEGSPWVYAPLPFLFVLIVTGGYLLVRPWIGAWTRRRFRDRRSDVRP